MEEFFLRQIDIWGKEGEEKISQACVLVAGIGGLGTHIAEALVRIGIGHLYIVDKAIVDAPDLNRQILYTPKDIGKPKVEVAEKRLSSYSLRTKITPLYCKIDKNFEIPDEVEIVIDALDNWETRFILEEKCYQKKIPLIHAGLTRNFGQVTTIFPEKTKLLKEIFTGVKDEKIPHSAYVGICMLLASIQVNEALKIILGKENTLLNKLLIIDLLNLSFEIIEL